MLTGLNILVTRPKPQGEILCEKIRAQLGNAIYFPMIDIIPLTPSDKLSMDYDWFIFTSMHAVYHGAKWIQPFAQIAAIGMGTLMVLREMKYFVHAYPKTDWRSEGLLALPEFAVVKGKKIAIIQGEGGRSLLEETLSARGAILTKIIVYQRHIPSGFPQLNFSEIDVIIATSGEILQNLKTMFTQVWQNLYQIPVVVISARLMNVAQQLGFKKIFLAKNASHDAIITLLSRQKG